MSVGFQSARMLTIFPGSEIWVFLIIELVFTVKNSTLFNWTKWTLADPLCGYFILMRTVVLVFRAEFKNTLSCLVFFMQSVFVLLKILLYVKNIAVEVPYKRNTLGICIKRVFQKRGQFGICSWNFCF